MKCTAATAIRHEGQSYGVGDPIDLTDDEAQRMAKRRTIDVDDAGSPVPHGRERSRPKPGRVVRKSAKAKSAAAAKNDDGDSAGGDAKKTAKAKPAKSTPKAVRPVA